jgi:hypothetical protein
VISGVETRRADPPVPPTRPFGHVRGWRWGALILLVALPLCGAMVVHRFESHLGLTGTYFRHPYWQQPAFTVVDSFITTRDLSSRFAPFGQNPFSVTWQGFLAIERAARYDFVTRSDDGTTLLVDGSLVVDNAGPHSSRARSGSVFLRPGFHAIQLTYQQFGGGYDLEVGWRIGGQALEPFPRTALVHGTPPSWGEYRFVTWMREWVLLVPFVWIGLLEIWLLRRFAGSLWRFIGKPSFPEIAALGAILGVSTVLNLVGLTWGLPNGGWAPDEVLPGAVLDGMGQLFSGGWYVNYPLLQYYILSILYFPFWVLSTIANASDEVYAELAWVNRLACVHMAVATLVVVYALAREARGAFAGLVAVAATALLPAFVYYGKIGNLEVPYVFWTMCALTFYGRAVMDGSGSDYWRFALFATLAACTKDQAFGLFVLPAGHLVIVRAQQLRREARGRLWRLAVDPALGRAVLVAVVAFGVSHNLLFNWTGFVSHVTQLTRSEVFQAFPATPKGQLQMLVSSLAQLPWLFGWPMACVVTIALVTTFLDRRARRRLWLLLPAVSYYVFFVSLVLYNYDRFFLPVCVLLAVLVGCWAEDVRDRVTSRPVRFGVITAACVVAVYTFAYAASIDRMMLYDARYGVEDWISANVPGDARIGTAGSLAYLPRLSAVQGTIVDYESLLTSPPEFVVVNSEHMSRYPPDSNEGRLYAELNTGATYRLVLSHKTAFWFAPLTAQAETLSRIEESNTNLNKINPRIQVFQAVKVGQ